MCSGSLKKTFTLDDIAAAKIGNNKYQKRENTKIIIVKF